MPRRNISIFSCQFSTFFLKAPFSLFRGPELHHTFSEENISETWLQPPCKSITTGQKLAAPPVFAHKILCNTWRKLSSPWKVGTYVEFLLHGIFVWYRQTLWWQKFITPIYHHMLWWESLLWCNAMTRHHPLWPIHRKQRRLSHKYGIIIVLMGVLV